MISFDLPKYNSCLDVYPRKWQKELIKLIRRRLLVNNTLGTDVLVHAGPGAGKTLGALLSFKAMKEELLLERFLVFCHRNSIVEQWRKSSQRLGLRVELGDLCQPLCLPKNVDGLIFTYQGVSKKNREYINKILDWSSQRTIAIADEAHHLGIDPDEPDGQVWGRSFLGITANNTLRLGLTGTPFRADNLAFCSARTISVPLGTDIVEQITPDLCIEPRDLIDQGDVRPLEFHFQDGWVEHNRAGTLERDFSTISNENRESWRARNLRNAVCISGESTIALNLLMRARKKLETIRLKHKNAAGLIIAKDIDHSKAIANLLKENGDSVELVHSNEKKANIRLVNFEKGTSKWLVSIDMCSEGFDAPRLRLVAYLTTVATRSRFVQAITRAVRVSGSSDSADDIPREPSYVFAPADPLLMEYARTWSISKPYLIRSNNLEVVSDEDFAKGNGISLPMEAINHESGRIIRMRTLELPGFLKR